MGREHDFEDCKGVFNPYNGKYMQHEFICNYDKGCDGHSQLQPMHKYDYDRE